MCLVHLIVNLQTSFYNHYCESNLVEVVKCVHKLIFVKNWNVRNVLGMFGMGWTQLKAGTVGKIIFPHFQVLGYFALEAYKRSPGNSFISKF